MLFPGVISWMPGLEKIASLAESTRVGVLRFTMPFFVLPMLLPLGLWPLGCGPSGAGRSYTVSTERDFVAQFSTKLLVEKGLDLDFAMIDSQAQRRPLEVLLWSATDGILQFRVYDQDFYPPQTETPLDQLFAMGGEGPSFDQKKFGRRILGQLRIEARPRTIPNQHALVPYTQVFLPLSRSISLNSQKGLTVSDEAALQLVGASRVRIVDETQTPIPNAKVMPFPSAEIPVSNGGTMPIWQSSMYRPIINLSDDRGFASLIPIVPSGSYQVVALADGYCPFVSETMAFDEKTAITSTLTLSKCSELSDKMRFTMAWSPEIQTYQEKRNDGNTYSFAYTNQDNLTIFLKNTSRELRPLRISVFEEPGENRAPCLYEGYPQTTKTSNSKLTVKLPVQFYQGQCNAPTKIGLGVFFVKVEALDKKGEVIYTDTLYGKKSTVIPQAVDATKVDIKNPQGLTSAISGLKGSTLTLQSLTYCKARRSIGIRRVGATDIVFKSCSDDLDAVFTVDELGLSGDGTIPGQFVSFEVFIKDEFANVSIHDKSANKINTKADVFVDYGVPDLEEIRSRFTTHYGFAKKGTISGLPSGDFPDLTSTTTDTVVLTNSTMSNFVFRFEQAASCVTIGNEADGTGSPRRGALIQGFVLGPTANRVEQATSFENCAEGGNPKNYNLKSGDIVLPSNPAASAQFYLRIVDSSGNTSAPALFSIPPCPANVETIPTNPRTTVCWR